MKFELIEAVASLNIAEALAWSGPPKGVVSVAKNASLCVSVQSSGLDHGKDPTL